MESEYDYTHGTPLIVVGDDLNIWKLFDKYPMEKTPTDSEVRLFGKMDGVPFRIDLSIDGAGSTAVIYTTRRYRNKLEMLVGMVEERLREMAAVAESRR